MTHLERVAYCVALGYLLLLGIAMQLLSFDIWGALVVAPILIVITYALLPRAFNGDLAPLRRYAWIGLIAKFGGAVVGYYISFTSYDGAADAALYHDLGVQLAGEVRSGVASPLALLPTDTGVFLIGQLNAVVYSITGPTRLGSFLVFAWLSYWGLIFMVKAAVFAVPHLGAHRYALAVFVTPSLVFWGSAIGKDAIVGFTLGVSAYGVALMLAHGTRRRGAMLTVVGLLATGRVRPHFAAIFAGAAFGALLVNAIRERSINSSIGRRAARRSTLGLLIVASAAFIVLSAWTLTNFSSSGAGNEASVTDRFGMIFARTGVQTDTGGSTFETVSLSQPLNWPYASVRTLTRPIITDAQSFGELLASIEMTALLVVGLISWRRLLNLPRLMITTPYVTFAVLALFSFGIAFSNVANLGVLVRQRSLMLPLLLLLFCVPARTYSSKSSDASSREEANQRVPQHA